MSRSASRRRLVVVATVVLVAEGVAGCSEDEQPINSSPPAASASQGNELSASITDGPTVEASAPATEAGPDAPGAGAPDLVLQAGDFVDVTPTDGLLQNFQTPTGNIQCVFEAGGEEQVPYVECLVFEAAWSVQEDPNCEFDWVGTELSLSDDASVGTCRSDTFIQEDPPTLDYGQGWSAGPLACMSRQDGVTCSNSDTGHGFRAARGSYVVF